MGITYLIIHMLIYSDASAMLGSLSGQKGKQ